MMISIGDILHIISEIHQYSIILLEMRNGIIYLISRGENDKPRYSRFEGDLQPREKHKLLREARMGELTAFQQLSVEDFLRQIEGGKTRHIWLETSGAEPKEHVFLTIAELKAFFKSHSHR